MIMAKPSLLLLHGICNNVNLFAVPDGLGHYLSRYFKVFPISYPLERHRNQPWDFDFHLHCDMPAIWQQVCALTGEKPFVLGYSMGGMLAMAAQSAGIIDAPAIITVASPFNFSFIPLYPPLMRTWVRFSGLTGYRTVPVRLLGRILCAFMASVKSSATMLDLNLFRHLVKTASVNVPLETILQALVWTKTRKFTDRTGKIDYLNRFSEIKTPVCMIYGSKDRIAPRYAVEAGFNAIKSIRKAFMEIAGGTHVNMISGENARKISELADRWCNHSAKEGGLDFTQF